jgi:hypothetical protein
MYETFPSIGYVSTHFGLLQGVHLCVLAFYRVCMYVLWPSTGRVHDPTLTHFFHHMYVL